jgi:hypothetical protein
LQISEEFEELALRDLYKSIGFEEETSGKTLGKTSYPVDYVKTKISLSLGSARMFSPDVYFIFIFIFIFCRLLCAILLLFYLFTSFHWDF